MFSISLKSAFVTPILKQPNLDKENLKNYRPISKLAFLGKVIERCDMNQIVQYFILILTYSLLLVGLQFYSIETALTHVYNDILMDLVNKNNLTTKELQAYFQVGFSGQSY